MGRWGMRLFEGDQDLDIVCDLDNAFGSDEQPCLSKMILQTDVAENIVTDVRKMLDSGKGEALFDMFRCKENEFGGHYRLIIVGALMMRAGAKIRTKDIEHLRDLVPKIHCSPGYALPICDDGFRGPGRAQFLAALNSYEPGTPHNYEEPSCYNCGKVKGDTGSAMMICSRCKTAWYCNTDCQRRHWKAHKPGCVPEQQRFMLNV